MKKRIAIYDFDKTLVKIDTYVEFFRYLEQKNKASIVNFDNQFKFNLQNDVLNMLTKLQQIYELKGMTNQSLESFSESFVNDILINEVNLEIINQFKVDVSNSNVDVVVISASFSFIIRKFFSALNITNYKLIAIELEKRNGVQTGNIDKIHPMGLNKFKALKEILNLDEYNLEDSTCYTDNISDIPILALVGKRFVVHGDKFIDDWSTFFNCVSLKV